MKKVEKHCRRCGQRFWVPAALGDLRLTCPKCKYCWDEFGATLEGLNPESAESKGDLTEVRCHDCGCLIYKNELVRRDVRVGSSYFSNGDPQHKGNASYYGRVSLCKFCNDARTATETATELNNLICWIVIVIAIFFFVLIQGIFKR